MIVFDNKGGIVENPDYDKGTIENKTINIVHKYVVDIEKQSHYETIREYPETGGKDVEEVIDVEEQGHWDTYDERGDIVEHYDGVIAEDWPHEQDIHDVWEYGIYTPYTPEQLKEIEKAKAEGVAAGAQQMQMNKAIMFMARANAKLMSDSEVVEMSTLFDEWRVGTDYKTKDVLRYEGNLYRVLQDVTNAQADHTPDKAVSLYKRIGEPVDGVYPWVQPLGATDAYAKGDKVLHKDKTWVSDIDNNVWEPSVYGWTEDGGTNPEPEPEPQPEPSEYPAWKQPTGGHDAYKKGAKVSHKGKNWQSTVDANVWEPSVYGWVEVA